MARWMSWCGLALGLASAACGPELDRISEVASLRVLGLQKSTPYGRPGEAVEFSLLTHDGRPPEAQTPVTITWLPACFNPAGDLYYGCFQQLVSGGGPPGTPPPTEPVPLTFLPQGPRHTLTLPPDVIEGHGPPLAGPEYGLAYVFFAVCGGTLLLVPGAEGLPLRCQGPDGEYLPSDGFVAGYASLYVYRDLVNSNPVVGGFAFNDVDVDTDCVDGACLDPEPADPACGDGDTPCVDACPEDGDPAACDGFPIRPILDRSIVEPDMVAPGGLDEQIWISYFVDRGQVKSELKLVNDAATGWNPEHHTEFYAPKEPGPVYVWAVVRDNRGGAAWTRMKVFVR